MMDQHPHTAQDRTSAPRDGPRRKAADILHFCVFFSVLGATAASAETASSFASSEACRSSGFFSAGECVAAFAEAADLLRDRAPRFSNRIDCVLSFKLCEWRDGAHWPSMLGVEIRKTPGGTVALPVLAVEPPVGLLDVAAERMAAPAPRPAGSPFGDLPANASILTQSGPQTLAEYRQIIEATRLQPELALQHADNSTVPAR